MEVCPGCMVAGRNRLAGSLGLRDSLEVARIDSRGAGWSRTQPLAFEAAGWVGVAKGDTRSGGSLAGRTCGFVAVRNAYRKPSSSEKSARPIHNCGYDLENLKAESRLSSEFFR
jgi:hypothetical protein